MSSRRRHQRRCGDRAHAKCVGHLASVVLVVATLLIVLAVAAYGVLPAVLSIIEDATGMSGLGCQGVSWRYLRGGGRGEVR